MAEYYYMFIQGIVVVDYSRNTVMVASTLIKQVTLLQCRYFFIFCLHKLKYIQINKSTNL